MYQKNKLTVCYMLDGIEYMIQQSDENLCVTAEICKKSEKEQDIVVTIRNTSLRQVFLKYVVLWQASSVKELEIGDGPYRVYRSGRHKNDMPGTFTLGVPDESMKDVLGAMTESGDKAEAGKQVRKLSSDHLTIFTGSKESLLVTFTGGREQLFETEIILDENYELERVKTKAVFHIYLKPAASVECEELKLVRTNRPEEEVTRFAKNKGIRYGSRRGLHPSVFCTWYYYGLTVSYEDVKTNLEIMQKRKLPFDVFQLDEGWEICLGEWEANEKFPVPMKQLADEIRSAGYRPGIWSSPFIAHESASLWKEHPEWILKDKEGKPYLFPMNDMEYLVLPNDFSTLQSSNNFS